MKHTITITTEDMVMVKSVLDTVGAFRHDSRTIDVHSI